MLKKLIKIFIRFMPNPLVLLTLPKDIIKKTSPNDLMYKTDKYNYFNWGKWALACIRKTLQKVDKKNIRSILDLPCGHGRTLRFLKAAFPEAVITACEIDKDGVDFCVNTFGVRGAYSTSNPVEIPIKEKFDLIWCGSLLTHLNQDKWHGFIKFFSDHLEENGVLIFTTHGECIVKYLREGRGSIGLEPKLIPKILEDYDSNGFGYINYFGHNDYGVSLSSVAWVLNLLKEFPQLDLIEHDPKGWGSTKYHQDSFAVIRKN